MPVSAWVRSTYSSGATVIKEEAFERMKSDPEYLQQRRKLLIPHGKRVIRYRLEHWMALQESPLKAHLQKVEAVL